MSLQTNTLTPQFSSKLQKICYLLQSPKKQTNTPVVEIAKDLRLYLSLIEKPINLLFSIDQFVFEFSKTKFQQKKSGEFFQQLKERKKLSIFYGDLPRKHLAKLFQDARKMKGYFSRNLVALVESRLDVVLYRSGLVTTIAEGRQLIKHKKVRVNNKFGENPSNLLKPGDLISLQKIRLAPHLVKTHQDKKQKPQIRFMAENFLKHLNSFLTHPLVKQSHSKKVTTPKQSVLNSPSKIGCNLLTQLICTQIKLRSSWNTKQIVINSVNLQTSSSQKSKVTEKNFLTTFKWKRFSKVAPNPVVLIQPKLPLDKKKTQQQFATEGCLQKLPVFYTKSPILREKKKDAVSVKFQKKRTSTFLGATSFAQSPMQKKDWWKKYYLTDNFLNLKISTKNSQRKIKYENNSRIQFYRLSFLGFLKQLNSHKKFSNLVGLKIKNFLFSPKSSQLKSPSFSAFHSASLLPGVNGNKISHFTRAPKSPLIKRLNFRTLRPLNFEVSYNLLTVIYLFTPQRVNFPFFIDFDLIKRSLR